MRQAAKNPGSTTRQWQRTLQLKATVPTSKQRSKRNEQDTSRPKSCGAHRQKRLGKKNAHKHSHSNGDVCRTNNPRCHQGLQREDAWRAILRKRSHKCGMDRLRLCRGNGRSRNWHYHMPRRRPHRWRHHRGVAGGIASSKAVKKSLLNIPLTPRELD